MSATIWLRRRAVWFTSAALLILSAGFARLRQGEDFEYQIRQGKLIFTQRCGWLNLNHSDPGAPAAFLTKYFEALEASNGLAFDIRYCQHMVGCYGMIGVRSSIERTYRVSGVSDRKSAEKIAWSIFVDLSTAYEEMQGSFPEALDKACEDSSFRAGDLLGDRVAFYRALRGYSECDVNAWLRPLSVAESVAELRRQSAEPDRNWRTQNLPSELNNVPDDAECAAAHVVLLEEKRTSLRLSLR